MFKKRIKKSRATWLGLLLKRGNSRRKLRKHHSERGIAIPLVIGMGLLMLLLSITVIVRSQSSRVNSISQNQSAQAAEVAESGMAQVQSVFADYVQLSRISLANIKIDNSNPANNITTWKNASGAGAATCSTGAGSGSVLLNSLLKKDDNTLTDAWAYLYNGTSVDSTRRFRVLAYDYQPSNSKGVTQNGTINSGTFTITKNASTVISGITFVPVSTGSPIIPRYSSLVLGDVVYGQIAGIPGNLKVTDATIQKPATNVYSFTPVSRTSDTADTIVTATATATGTTTAPANNIFYPISTGNANTDSGIATLKVEGQIVSGSNVLAKSVLQAKIPVSPGNINTVPIPGAWAGGTFYKNNNGATSNKSIQGNLLVNSCNSANAGITPTIAAPYTLADNFKTSPISMPKVPDKLGTEVPLTSTGNINANLILPIPGLGYDSSTGGYGYTVGNMSGNIEITVNPNYKVTIYLSGNIEQGPSLYYAKEGQTAQAQRPANPAFNCSPSSTCPATSSSTETINITSTSVTIPTTSPVTSFPVIPIKVSDSSTYTEYLPKGGDVYGILGNGISGKLSRDSSGVYSFTPNTAPTSALLVPPTANFVPTTSYKPSNFRIYGTGPISSYVCFKGSDDMYAYILAPNYGFGQTGSGKIIGAVWVANMPEIDSCGASNPKIAIVQEVTWDDLGSALIPEFLPPTFGGTQTWQKSEVN